MHNILTHATRLWQIRSSRLAARLTPFILPMIDVSPEAPPGSENILKVVRWVSFGVGIAGVIGLLIIGGKMMIKNRRGEGAEVSESLGYWLVGCVIAAAAGSITGAFLSI